MYTTWERGGLRVSEEICHVCQRENPQILLNENQRQQTHLHAKIEREATKIMQIRVTAALKQITERPGLEVSLTIKTSRD